VNCAGWLDVAVVLLWGVAVELPALVVDETTMVELAFIVVDEGVVAELAFVELVDETIMVEVAFAEEVVVETRLVKLL
jgi:hypothetical protein